MIAARNDHQSEPWTAFRWEVWDGQRLVGRAWTLREALRLMLAFEKGVR